MTDTTSIEILDFHRILYAHTHTAENYAYNLDSRGTGQRDGDKVTGGIIEIGFVEAIPLVFRLENCREYTAGCGDVFIIPPMSDIKVRAVDGGVHRHITVECIIDCIIGEKAVGERALELPFVLSGVYCEKAVQAIRRAAGGFSPSGERDWFGQSADFMSILAGVASALHDRSSVGGSGNPPSHSRYCRGAEEYIRANIARRLTVTEIADHVGINKNYLTNIFSETVGMPIIEYINRLKLSHITELILRRGCGIREAAEQVGIDNVNYVSRMFKKYYGVTISQYKRTVM